MRISWETIALAALLSFAQTAIGDVIKQSSSGICHQTESPYYERTKNFSSYETLEHCLDKGGRLPKALIDHQVENTLSSNGNYKREYFGKGWADTDGDCQNSRHEALIAQSTAPVRYTEKGECRVTAGRWISPFTQAVIHDPSKVDIDHVVPLKWAWEHGADEWDQEKKEQFANDPANLLSVEASLNRSKGSKGVSRWLPPAKQCQYVLRFLRVIKKYGLHLPEYKASRYREIRLQTCGR